VNANLACSTGIPYSASYSRIVRFSCPAHNVFATRAGPSKIARFRRPVSEKPTYQALVSFNIRIMRGSEGENLVPIRAFRDLPDAELAKGVLESAGIECFLRDDTTIWMNWGWSNALGGVKVCVRAEDADAANQLLKQDAPEDFDVPGVGEYKQPRCPSCGSPDISLYDLDKPYSSLAAGLLLGVTVPVGHKKGQWWQCQVCDHVWPESDSASEEGPEPER